MRKYIRKETYKHSIRRTVICLVFVLSIYSIKYFVIGTDKPSPDNNKLQNFLVGALAPTPITPMEKELIETKETLEKTENDREYLRSELSSRGEIARREVIKREKLIEVMNKNLGGLLKNKGEAIYNASINNSYPPYLQCAIMIHETGNGTSRALKEKNNVGGLFKNGKLARYNSIDDSINDMAKRIKLYYIDEGRTTIDLFGEKYCPIGSNDDGTNKYWIPSVNKYYIKMLNESGGLM